MATWTGIWSGMTKGERVEAVLAVLEKRQQDDATFGGRRTEARK